MGKKLHYRGTQSLLLAKRKELWLCVNESLRMRSTPARNCGFAGMEDKKRSGLPRAFFLHWFSTAIWIISFQKYTNKKV